jgi:hypothetical protein
MLQVEATGIKEEKKKNNPMQEEYFVTFLITLNSFSRV